jgi:hypothetical protein
MGILHYKATNPVKGLASSGRPSTSGILEKPVLPQKTLCPRSTSQESTLVIIVGSMTPKHQSCDAVVSQFLKTRRITRTEKRWQYQKEDRIMFSTFRCLLDRLAANRIPPHPGRSP